jgi:hypothetical protein
MLLDLIPSNVGYTLGEERDKSDKDSKEGIFALSLSDDWLTHESSES